MAGHDRPPQGSGPGPGAGPPRRPGGRPTGRAEPHGQPGRSDPDLWEALARLPDKQRAAVAYHYLAGLPHKEVARITGGSTDAARRAAADGIKTLRAIYPEGALA